MKEASRAHDRTPPADATTASPVRRPATAPRSRWAAGHVVTGCPSAMRQYPYGAMTFTPQFGFLPLASGVNSTLQELLALELPS